MLVNLQSQSVHKPKLLPPVKRSPKNLAVNNLKYLGMYKKVSNMERR